MYLTADRVVQAMACARGVLGALKQLGGGEIKIKISIEEVQDIVAEVSGWTIQKEEVTYPQGQYIRGRLERYPGKIAKIHIRKDQEDDWKRLVATKELLHLIIDVEADMCPYGDEILDILVLEGHIGILSPETTMEGNRAQAELIAEIAAMETLYPLEMRRDDVAQWINGTMSLGKIALKYGIPEGIASTLLNPRYLDLIQRAIDMAN